MSVWALASGATCPGYTDINEAENDPGPGTSEELGSVRIDGIEGYAAYLTAMHRYLSTEVHVAMPASWSKSCPVTTWFHGRRIEHLDKKAGQQLLREAVKNPESGHWSARQNRTPGQTALCGNDSSASKPLDGARF